MWRYLYQLLISLDQFVNALLGGYADETISSRAGKAALEGKLQPAKAINMLFFWQDDHCFQSIEWDEGRTSSKLKSIRETMESVKVDT